MRCHEVTELTLAFIDGALDEPRAGALQRHLDACPRCREAYADEVELSAAFGGLEQGLAGGDFALDVMARIDALPDRQPAAEVVALHPLARWTLAPLLAAAAIALLVWWSGADWAGASALSEQLAVARQQADAAGSELSALAVGLRSSGEATYQQTGTALGRAGGAIEAVTLLAALACATLIAKFRTLARGQEVRS